MTYVIGIDGGGSKTSGLLCNEQGDILARAEAGPSNYHTAGLESAAKTLRGLGRDLCERAGIKPGELSVFLAGLAGLDVEEDRAEMRKALLKEWEIREGVQLVLVNDLRVALAGAAGGGAGVVLNAGTGSIAMGTDGAGAVARANGWGYLLGDEGSGFWLGLRAVRAGLRDFDGRGEKTALRKSVVDHFDLDEITDVLGEIYESSEPISGKVAKLAPLVLKAGRGGDRVALQILREGGRALAETSLAVFQRLGLSAEGAPLFLTGGLLRSSREEDPHMKSLKGFLEERLTGELNFKEPAYGPGIGALIMGLERAGVELEVEIEDTFG